MVDNGFAGGPSEAGCLIGVRNEARDGGCQRAWIEFLHQKSVLTIRYGFWISAPSECHDRKSMSHGRKHGAGQRFLVRGKNEEIGRGIHAIDIGNKARELHGILEVKLPNESLQIGFFTAFSREEQDAMWKPRAQIGKSVEQEHVPFFRHESRDVAEAQALLRNRETVARPVTIRLRNHRWNFDTNKNHFDAVRRQAALEHRFRDEIRYGDNAAGRAIPRHGNRIGRQGEFHTARDDHWNGAVRPRQPRRAERVRLVGMHDVHLTPTHQPPDR